MNFQFLLPIIVFVVTAFLMYFISSDENKSEPGTIMLRNVIPAAVIGVLVFAILKFKDSSLFNPEPMMRGNYFD